MAQLVVRNLDERVQARLHDLAEKNGQSIEDFVRETLCRVALDGGGDDGSSIGSRISARFSQIGLTEGETLLKLPAYHLEPPALD